MKALACCRLLLTQDSVDSFLLIMDVVRQVVKAARDHIDSEQASSTGNAVLTGCLQVERALSTGNAVLTGCL